MWVSKEQANNTNTQSSLPMCTHTHIMYKIEGMRQIHYKASENEFTLATLSWRIGSTENLSNNRNMTINIKKGCLQEQRIKQPRCGWNKTENVERDEIETESESRKSSGPLLLPLALSWR